MDEAKDSPEAFRARCLEWFTEYEKLDIGKEYFDGQPGSLDSYLLCQAFESRFSPEHARALRLGAHAASFLARIMDEMRTIEDRQ